MYCISCGVKLADTEGICPLCQTVVPVQQPETVPLYPKKKTPARKMNPHTAQYAVTAAFLLAAVICLMCDLQTDGSVSWFGYVMGALTLGYVCLVLPAWFRRPNPVIFVPCGFAAVCAYLLYIDLASAGGWFLSFALPVTGGFAVITTTVVALLRYVRGGRLYIFGGAMTALGLMMLFIENRMVRSFGLPFAGWSFYPMAVLVMLGALLLFLAICRPARQTMERKFFL